MENILLILLVTVGLLIFIEITEEEKIRKLEREMRIEKIKEHIKVVEELSEDIHALSEDIKVSCKNLQIEVKE